MFTGIPGVLVFQDDILIWRVNKNVLKLRLVMFLEVAKKNGVNLIKKMNFMCQR